MVTEMLIEVEAATRRLCAALKAGDARRIEQCYSPAADYCDPVLGELGAGSARRVWPLILANMRAPRWHFEIEDVGLTTSRMRSRVAFTFVPTNRPVALDIATELHVSGGRITHHSDLFERAQWLSAIPFPVRLLLPLLRHRWISREARIGLAHPEERRMQVLLDVMRRGVIGACMTGLGALSAPALAQDFLRPTEAVRIIMDSQPWSAQSRDGKNLTLTLNRDGTGSARGPMPFAMPITWEIKGESVCITVGPAGTKCVRFRRVASGFEGWNGTQLDLELTR